jgi:capsular polysaccharide biosynthesis protein
MFASGGHTTNVNFVSRAAPPLRATKPNKIKILLMSMVAGLGIGLTGPLGFELLFNRRIRCADDLERSFDIPVLVELDEIAPLEGTA